VVLGKLGGWDCWGCGWGQAVRSEGVGGGKWYICGGINLAIAAWR
jgi:hypothetical protein